MFTGFASENTPAIQVWDLFRTSSGTTRIGLADDCAPIQFFRTGGSATTINVYLPSSPIEGKQIKIINDNYSSTPQSIDIFSSESSPFSSSIIRIGAGQTLDLCYSKNFLCSSPAGVGDRNTGWIFLNQGPINSWNFNSIALGGNNNSAERGRSAVLGGSFNTASGQSSAVVGGSSNTASDTNAAVVGGSSNTASGLSAVVVGGTSNTANSAYAAVIAGNGSIASITNAVVVGGQYSTANGTGSIVIGGSQGTTRSITANFVYPASNSPITFDSGKSQLSTLSLGRQTTDATATRLASDAGAAGTTNQVILPNNSAYYVKGSIIATVTGGGNTKSWDFIATIKRGANAAATSIVGAVTLNVQAADAGAATWVVAITADTTNGGLAVTVTGQAATTIRWVAKLESTEVTY